MSIFVENNQEKANKFLFRLFLFGYIPIALIINLLYVYGDLQASGLYLLGVIFVCVFVWFNSDKLSDFNIDFFALLIFTAGLFLRRKFFSSIWLIFIDFALFFLFIIFLIFLVKNHKLLDRKKIFSKWLALGVLFGIVGSLFITYGKSYYSYNIFVEAPVRFLVLLPTVYLFKAIFLVVAFEEILFRGFLMGMLAKFDLPDRFILLMQTFFWIIPHTLHWNNPKSLIFLIVSGVFYGYITIKSKSLLPSMAAHGIHNAIVSLFFIG